MNSSCQCWLVVLFGASLWSIASSLALVSRRRRQLLSIWVATSAAASASAAETVGKDADCNALYCLGVWDGILADCNERNCVSSQDDTPSVFAEPWDYSEVERIGDPPGKILDRIVTLLQSSSTQSLQVRRILYVGDRQQNTSQLLDDDRYARVEFTDGAIGEFYVTPNDVTIQFRIAGGNLNNRKRSETIRTTLSFAKLPVLRNRQRSFFFVESDTLDRFGPRSSAMGPPAELRENIESREFYAPTPEVTQQFPLGGSNLFVAPKLPKK